MSLQEYGRQTPFDVEPDRVSRGGKLIDSIHYAPLLQTTTQP